MAQSAMQCFRRFGFPSPFARWYISITLYLSVVVPVVPCIFGVKFYSRVSFLRKAGKAGEAFIIISKAVEGIARSIARSRPSPEPE